MLSSFRAFDSAANCLQLLLFGAGFPLPPEDADDALEHGCDEAGGDGGPPQIPAGDFFPEDAGEDPPDGSAHGLHFPSAQDLPSVVVAMHSGSSWPCVGNPDCSQAGSVASISLLTHRSMDWSTQVNLPLAGFAV